MLINIYIGYIIGTYLGVYLKILPLFLLFLFFSILLVPAIVSRKYSNINLKILIKKHLIKLLTIILVVLIATLRIGKIELNRAKVFKEDLLKNEIGEEIKYAIKIIDKETLEYSNRYTGMLIIFIEKDRDKRKTKNIKVIFNSKEDLLIAKTYEIEGKLEKLKEERNYKGFNERKYYHSKGIDFRFNVKKTTNKTIKEDNDNKYKIVNSSKTFIDYLLLIKDKIYQNIDKYIANSNIFKALFLGNSNELESDIKLNFRSTNVYHVLAMSGMHISYLILFVNVFLKKLKFKINYKFKKCIQILILVFYMIMIGFSSSIARAVFIVIIGIVLKDFNIRYGFVNSILFSVFIILTINPYTIFNIGFYLSYVSALSIYFFLVIEKNLKLYDKISFFLNQKYQIRDKGKDKVKSEKSKKSKIKEIIINYLEKLFKFIFYNIYISFIVYISLLPLLIYQFGEINLNFILANLFVSILLPILMILGFFFIFFTLFLSVLSIIHFKFLTTIILVLNNNITIKLAKIIDLLLESLLFIVQKISSLNNIVKSLYYVRSLSIVFIFSFYIILLFIFYVFATKTSQFSTSEKYIKDKLKKAKNIICKRKILTILILIMFLFSNTFLNISVNNDEYKIAFLDVGQGDSSFIITPSNTTILVDAGSNVNFDNGKEIRRYIFARRKTKINHLFISHFDIDHIGGVYSLIDSIKIDKIYIPKYVGEYLEKEVIRRYGSFNNTTIDKIQESLEKGRRDEVEEDFLNYYTLKEKTRKKNIGLIELERGNILKLDKNTRIEVLFPIKELININFSNNNSLVFKLQCKSKEEKHRQDNDVIYESNSNKEFSVLYTGDIEKDGINKLLELDYLSNKNKSFNLQSDILKVPHHGSKYSLNKEFLNRIKPKISIISASKNNIYGHPHKEVLDILNQLKSKIFRTDVSGEIFLRENTIFLY